MHLLLPLLLAQTAGSDQTTAPPPPPVAPKQASSLACPTRMAPVADDRDHDGWLWGSSTLTGDWNGLREQLEDDGFVLQGRYTSIMMENFEGGLSTGFFGGGAAGVTLTIDTETCLDHDGGTVFIDWEYFDWYNGTFGRLDTYDPTGSVVGSNGNFIDDDQSGFNAIAQLYYDQQLIENVLSMRFGKMDANSTFSNIEPAGAFQYNLMHNPATLNPYFPTYPAEATALQAQLNLGQYVTGYFGWYDGTTAAYDPATGRSGPDTGTRGPATFFDNDGHWFLITEWSVSWSIDDAYLGSLAVGGWLQTGRTGTGGTDTQGVVDVPGMYATFQQVLWAPDRDTAKSGGGIQLFGQFGLSDPDKNPVHWSMMGGVSATGVIPGRPDDAIGLAGGWTAFSDNPGIYQSQLRNGAPGASGGHETAVEVFYKAQVTPWLFVQPGFEWIGSPGGGETQSLEDDVIGYLVVGMEF